MNEITKIPTFVPGFDHITHGGLPEGRTTLISGSAGSAKTVFAAQFICEGIIKNNENGIFVTFEESPEDIKKNMLSMGWDMEKFESGKKLSFVDASPQPGETAVVLGGFDLAALMARIENAVKKINAKRISLDSLGAIFSQFSDTNTIRHELFKIAHAIRKMNITAVLTAERTQEYGKIARYDVEEFVADNVILLRNILEDEKRRRTIEILKFRGTMHKKGEYPFTIIPGEGIVIIPLSNIKLDQKSSNTRISSGNQVLDKMCDGGFFRDSIILLSGATGTGKTLTATEFMAGGVKNGEKCLLFAFEESRQQLFRNATGWGIDFETMEKEGKLKVVCDYPETAGLEDHLIRIKKTIREFNPNRVAVDSLSALERISTTKGFREFVIGINSFIKEKEIAGLFTSTTSDLMGGTSITEAHISTITDSIILLRYVETFGEMRRGITVLKMRGSKHEKEIREFIIDNRGMHIGNPFREVSGIISGNLVQSGIGNEISRMENMFNSKEGTK